VTLDAEVIHVVGVTFTELGAPPGYVMNPDTRVLHVTTCVTFPQEVQRRKSGYFSVADCGKYFSTEKGNGDKPRPLTDTFDV